MRFQVVALVFSAFANKVSAFYEDACTTDIDCTGTYDKCYSGTGCGECSTDDECKTTYSDVWVCKDHTCTVHVDDGCACDSKCEEDFKAKFYGMSFSGAAIGVIFLIVSAVPCCCGQDFNSKLCPKIAGVLSVVVGIIVCFFPAIGAGAAVDGAIEDTCAACDNGCDEETKKSIKATLTGFGILMAYTGGLGFFAVIIGIVAAAIGCCTICPCCGPLKNNQQKPAAGSAAVAGAVVGQPA